MSEKTICIGGEDLLSECEISRYLAALLTLMVSSRLAEGQRLLLTPYERNIQVWRQLWRVIERSQLIVQIVDARNPLKFRCKDLEGYVSEVGIGPSAIIDEETGEMIEQQERKGIRRNLLLINKSDLLTRAQR
jgi:large subunit GTPase 1